jgi:hypothetical protein
VTRQSEKKKVILKYKKGKVSLYTPWRHKMEVGSIALLIFNLGTRWRSVVSLTPRPLYPRGKNILGWVVPTANLDVLKKRKLLVPSGILTPDRATRSLGNVEKYGRARQAIDDNIIWRMRFACWITKATDIHSEYAILIAFPRQQCLRERAPSLMLYVHCLFCSFLIPVRHVNIHLISFDVSSLSVDTAALSVVQ